MSQQDIERRLSGMQAYDLQDLTSQHIDDYGQLEVASNRSSPIYVKLGHDILEMTHISDPQPNDSLPMVRGNGFVIRNLTAGRPAEPLLIDDSLQPATDVLDPREWLPESDNRHVVIGRGDDATPQLALHPSVSRRHLSVRFGTFASKLVFRDLNSTNGSTVYVDSAEAVYRHPRKEWFIGEGLKNMVPKVARDGRWKSLE